MFLLLKTMDWMMIERIRHFGSAGTSQWSCAVHWALSLFSLLEAQLIIGLLFQVGSKKQIYGNRALSDIGWLFKRSLCETTVFVTLPVYTDCCQERNVFFVPACKNTGDVAWTAGRKASDDLTWACLLVDSFLCVLQHLSVFTKTPLSSFMPSRFLLFWIKNTWVWI